MKNCLIILAGFLSLIAISHNVIAEENGKYPDGWVETSPRPEIAPKFSYLADARGAKHSAFVIEHDEREGLDGWFQKSFEVKGGEYVSFAAYRKSYNVTMPRRSALCRIVWKDKEGRGVKTDITEQELKLLGHNPSAEPEFPVDGETNADGWTKVSGIYPVPLNAATATVELHLQWSPGGKVLWSDISLTKTTAPVPRVVRLGTVHYSPSGKSIQENREEFVPFIEDAAKKKADLVVLGETITYVKLQKKPHEVAESVPGPSTEFFGKLAKKHNMHLVVCVYESEKHLVYNTAALIGPDGKMIGKYRKVTLPHGEVERGVAPGKEYPVFDTSLGKIGMMICYDGFYPEVARQLSNKGAEVIAWPVWGCNPLLAKARACENHVYIVSSTYMKPQDNWMLSAVFDQSGTPIAQAESNGTVVVAEVDLSKPFRGPYNLGDFHSMINRHRPESLPELKSNEVKQK